MPASQAKRQFQFHRGASTRLNQGEGHDAILHLLNRKIENTYFPVEPFAATVDEWAGIPLIYAPDHIDFSCRIRADEDDNLQTFLDEVDGVVVGEVANPAIDLTGHPRLMGQFVLTEDTAGRLFEGGKINEDTRNAAADAIQECQTLIEEGNLSLSTAFCCPENDDGVLEGKVRPNHVLVFREDEHSQPKDRGAVILNKEGAMRHENVGKTISEKNKSEFKAALDSLWGLFKKMAGTSDEDGEKTQNAEVVVAPASTDVRPVEGSLEGTIEIVRNALSNRVGLSWEDGSPRMIWSLLTLPDQVIWQHPVSLKYFATGYAIEGDAVTFGEQTEVEQAFVVKQANAVLHGVTADDLETIRKRNMAETPQAAPDPRDTEIEALKQKNAEMQGKLAEMEKARKDTAWSQLKNKLPAGLVHTSEDEAKTRELFEKDPMAFANMILDHKMTPPTGEEGETFTNGPDGQDEQAKTNKILEEARGAKTPGQLH